MRNALAWASFAACCAVAIPVWAQKSASPEFVAQPIDGEPMSGRLVAIEKPWRVTLQNSQRKTLDGGDLVELRRMEQPQVPSITASQVLLANGDRIRASAQRASQELLHINSELLGDLEIPLEKVQAIVNGTPADPSAREKLLSGLMAGQRKQDVVVLANGDEIKGTFLAVDEKVVRLEGVQGAMEISRAGVRAIKLSSDLISFPRPKEMFARVFLADGSQLSMLDGRLEGGDFRGRAAFDRQVTIPIEQLVAMEFCNGRLTYLSDIEPAEYQHTPYLGISYPYQRDRTVMGNVLSLRGQAFRKGLGVHSRSDLLYRLDGQFKRFEAIVGIDDETAGKGSVVFRVLVDGKPAWESPALTGQLASQRIQIDVARAQRLTLVVDFGAWGDVQDHADWAEARLVR